MFLLRKRRAPKPTFSAPISPDEQIFAVGDLHGRKDLLDRLLARLAEQATEARIVFVGDYIDRGDDSAAVLQRLQQLEEDSEGRVICLKGNHEDMLLKFMQDPASVGARWMQHGGLQTMASFAVSPPSLSASKEDWETARDQLSANMRPSLLAWMEARPLYWRSGNVAFVHAGADPNAAIETQSGNTLMWGHPDFGKVPRMDGLWIVHGHTIVNSPEVSQGCISIDTGAYATGRLTAVLLHPDNPEPDFLMA